MYFIACHSDELEGTGPGAASSSSQLSYTVSFLHVLPIRYSRVATEFQLLLV